MNGDWELRSMTAGLKAKIFEPETMRRAEGDRVIRVADAIGVHGAMQVHARKAIAMRLQDALDGSRIGIVRCAFVVNHDIIAFGVLWISQNLQRRMGGRIISMNLVDDDVCARLDAL